MLHRNRHRLKRLATTGVALGVGIGLLGVSGPAFADPNPASAGPASLAYTASSSADLLHAAALTSSPFGVNTGSLADLRVSHADSSVDSTKPHSEAHAANLKVNALNDLIKAKLQAANQTAPPDNPNPATTQLLAANLGAATIGAGEAFAQARWNDSCANPNSPTTITDSRSSLASAQLLPSDVLGNLTNTLGLSSPLAGSNNALVDIPSVGYAQSKTALTNVDGQSQLGVQADARISLAQLTLFKGSSHEVTVKVISAPTLTATAAGTDKSSVKYTSPVLEVTDAHHHVVKLDAPNASVNVPLLGDLSGDLNTADSQSNKGALLRLSVGSISKKSVSPTAVSAEAATLRLEVLDVPGHGKLLDLGIGELSAKATIQAGGISNPSPSQPSQAPSQAAGGGAGGSLPVTGTNMFVILGAGLALIIAGRFVMVMARRRNGTPPPSAS